MATLLGLALIVVTLVALQESLDYIDDVLPEWLPLLLSLPYIGALEHWHYVADICPEELAEVKRVCLHVVLVVPSISLTSTRSAITHTSAADLTWV